MKKPLRMKLKWSSYIIGFLGLVGTLYGVYSNHYSLVFLGIPLMMTADVVYIYALADREKMWYDFFIVLPMLAMVFALSILTFELGAIPRTISIKVPASTPDVHQSYNGTILLSCAEYSDKTVSCMPFAIRNVGQPFQIPHIDDVINTGICDYDVPNFIFNCTWDVKLNQTDVENIANSIGAE